MNIRTIGKLALLTGFYFITARLGLKIAAVSTFAALVWPPSGIALVALFLFGYEFWISIFIGAFLVNWSIGAPVPASLGIGMGNALEALLGAAVLRKFSVRPKLDSLSSVFLLTGPVAVGCTLISPCVGVLSLYLSGKVVSTDAISTAFTWWLGDGMGILLFSPFLLVWSTRPSRQSISFYKVIESVFMGGLTTLIAFAIFTDWLVTGNPPFPKPFYIFPMMIVLASRVGPRAVVAANLLLAILIIVSTAIGQGRFLVGSASQNLMQVQIFLSVISVTTLFLAASVAERKRLFAQAEEAIRMRDEFLSVVSHELKNPLTSLYLRLQMFNFALEKGANPSANITTLPLPAAKAFHLCRDQCNRVIQSLNSLLDLTRIRFDQLQLIREPTDLQSLIMEILEFLKVEAAQKNVSIDVQAGNDPIVGDWDRMRIEQVIVNLTSNAIKYGGGTPIKINLGIDSEKREAKLQVIDSGPGIQPQNIDKIFNRFERAEKTNTKTSGLGLGLYICRKIVLAHGGKIEAESTVGQGTTFTVTLPLLDQA